MRVKVCTWVRTATSRGSYELKGKREKEQPHHYHHHSYEQKKDKPDMVREKLDKNHESEDITTKGGHKVKEART